MRNTLIGDIKLNKMKANKLLILLLISGVYQSSIGQVTEAEKTLRTQSADTLQGWKKGGIVTVSLAQTSLTNWASGGQSSVAVNGLFSIFANYKKGTNAWDNSLDLGYGLLKEGTNSHARKTDDKIDFLSKYGKLAFKNFYYSALLNLKTQMTAGYNYPNDLVKISDFFAPAYLLGALGMDYKPNAYFSAFLAPLTEKLTFVRDKKLSDAGAFGVKPGASILSEFGGYLRIIYSRNDFKNDFLKNISFTSKIDLFSNYLKNPQNIVINWENLITMKVNKYITVNFNTLLIYDDKIKIKVDRNNDGILDAIPGPRIQFKEILGVGFSYKF
jgi:hypothetical protein